MNKDDGYRLTRITPRETLDYHNLTALGGLDPYGQHRLLWRFFDLPKDNHRQRTPFLFRAEVANGLPLFYVLSTTQISDSKGQWIFESKTYRPQLAVGDRLAFKLRANPIVERSGAVLLAADGTPRLRTSGAKEGQPKCKVARHDVVMDAKRRMNWASLAPDERPMLAHLAQDAGSRWLQAREVRLGCHFEVDRLRADGYRTHRMRGRGIILSTLDFEGELTITDAARFNDALLHGIGPAKSFGCGLLLVRRAAS